MRATAGYAAPGRPKDARKRTAILDAARRQFLTYGYAQSAIESIAAEANVSKMTVYGHFGDKPALFEAWIRDEVERSLPPLPAPRTMDALADALRTTGRAVLGMMSRPELAGARRLFTVEAHHYPAVARCLWEYGPAYVRRQLAALLTAARRNGVLATIDSAQAAEMLVAVWYGPRLIDLCLGAGAPLKECEIEAYVEATVGLFLRGFERGACAGAPAPEPLRVQSFAPAGMSQAGMAKAARSPANGSEPRGPAAA